MTTRAQPPLAADARAPAAAARPAGFTLTPDASLRAHNTFGVDAHAACLIEIHDLAAVPDALASAAAGPAPILLLGEGSNVLVVDDWPGTVVNVQATGVEVLDDNEECTRIRVAAGEHWDDCVRWTLAQGWPGLENLIMIPGSVGAAPMQNIGAYGVEVGEFVESVDAYDLAQRRAEQFTHDQCEFGYRDSVFKRHPDRWLITCVTLRLPHAWTPRTEYRGLQEELARMGVTRSAPIHIADAVQRLRTRKLPDPAVIGNAGSFFKNPIVPADVAAAVQRAHPGIPAWPADGGTKLPAAALIEAAGFKGAREGDAGISNRHALVLVNHGHATGRELLAFAERVRSAVSARFGITLEPEPRVIRAPEASAAPGHGPGRTVP